jgi:hypothetical protein
MPLSAADRGDHVVGNVPRDAPPARCTTGHRSTPAGRPQFPSMECVGRRRGLLRTRSRSLAICTGDFLRCSSRLQAELSPTAPPRAAEDESPWPGGPAWFRSLDRERPAPRSPGTLGVCSAGDLPFAVRP